MEKRVAIITGASTGLGKEMALLLRKNNIVVYAGARDIEKNQDLINHDIKVRNLDVTNTNSIKKFVDFVLEKEKRIDILVNNAGYGIFGPVELISEEEAKKQFDVNVFGVAQMSKNVIPTMRKQNSGLIINVTSMVGKIGLLLGDWYVSSKFALEGLSDCMRMDLKPFNINVVKLEPGIIYTPWYEKMAPKFIEDTKNTAYAKESEKTMNWLVSAAKTSKTTTLDVANAVLEITKSNNPKSSYVVGQEAIELWDIKNKFGEEKFEEEIRNRILK